MAVRYEFGGLGTYTHFRGTTEIINTVEYIRISNEEGNTIYGKLREDTNERKVYMYDSNGDIIFL